MNKPQEVINYWTSRLLSRPESAAEIASAFKFIVEGKDGGVWLVDCRGLPEVLEGSAAEQRTADCVVSMSSEDFMKVANGNLNPQAAFLSGKIRVKGDISRALKLEALF